MPQLFLLMAAGVVGWLGYKQLKKEARRVSESVRRAEKEAETGAIGTLVQDPETGEYRVQERDRAG